MYLGVLRIGETPGYGITGPFQNKHEKYSSTLHSSENNWKSVISIW
jgi:hypothetical protein